MTTRSDRLALALLRIFQFLRILMIVGLVVLVPTMLFAWFYPGEVANRWSMRANGRPIGTDAMLAGNLMLIANLLLLAGLVVVTKLIGMMRTVVARAPFVSENVARLRVIAAVMGASVLVQTIGGFLFNDAQRRFYDIPVGRFDLGLFLGMLVVLVLAEVFREGVRLSEESEGTI